MKEFDSNLNKQNSEKAEKDWNNLDLVSLSSFSSSSLSASSTATLDAITPSTMTISTVQMQPNFSPVKQQQLKAHKQPTLKSLSTNYMDKKYSLSTSMSMHRMRKIDDVKSFISSAYDHINESKEKSSTRQRGENESHESRKLKPIEVSESAFVSSANKILLKKYSNSQPNSISLSSYDLSNNEGSDSGYTKSVATNSVEQLFADKKSVIESVRNNAGSAKLERPKRCDSSRDKLVERLKDAVEFSEERRKLLLTKFTEAQELLQFQLKRLKQSEAELKSKTKEAENMKALTEELQSQNSKLVSEKKNNQEISNQSMHHNDQLKLKIAELESLLRETKSESIKLKTECRDKNDLIDELLQAKTFVNMEKSQLEIEYSQLEINIDEIRSENSELKLRVSSLEKDLNRQKASVKEANTDYQNMQQLLLEREKNWSNLRSKLEETMVAKEKLYNEHLDLMQQFNEYKQAKNDSGKELVELRSSVNLKSSEIEALKIEKIKFVDANESLRVELNFIKQDRDTIKQQIEDFRKHIGKMCEEFAKVKEEKEKEDASVRAYKLNYNEEKFQKLQNDLNQMRLENQEAESTIQANEEDIEKLQSQLKSKNTTLAELSQKLKLTEKYQSELENMKTERLKIETNYENDINDLKNEIDELKKSENETGKFKMTEEEFKLIQYEYEEKIIELEEEVEKLIVEKQYFQTKCEENEQLIQFLETQLKLYNKDKSDSNNSLTDDDAYSFTNKTDASCNQQNNNHIDSLKSQIKSISDKCTEYEENDTKLNRELLQLKQKCELYEAEIRGLKSGLDDMSAFKGDYESQMSENMKLKAKFKNLEMELETINLQHQKSVESLKQSKEHELFILRQKLDLSETSLKESLDKINQISKDYMDSKNKCNELELFIEREKSSKLKIENEYTDLKTKLKKTQNEMKETQLSHKRNEEISMRYKSQMNDILTEMQILRAQLEDSKDVQNKQDDLIKSLKYEIMLKETKKNERIKKYENEINRLQEALGKLQSFLGVQVRDDYDSNDSNASNNEQNIVTLVSETGVSNCEVKAAATTTIELEQQAYDTS